MICTRCRLGTLRPDANGQIECDCCHDHPGPLRDADLAAIDAPVTETPEELAARHEARLQAAEPGVTRRVFVVGAEPKRVVPDERDEELARLRAQVEAVRAILADHEGELTDVAFGALSALRAVVEAS